MKLTGSGGILDIIHSIEDWFWLQCSFVDFRTDCEHGFCTVSFQTLLVLLLLGHRAEERSICQMGLEVIAFRLPFFLTCEYSQMSYLGFLFFIYKMNIVTLSSSRAKL